jgi:hypothetical protein
MSYKEKRTLLLDGNVMRAFTPMGKDDGYDFGLFINSFEKQLKKLLDNEKNELATVISEWEVKRIEFDELKIESDKQREQLFIALEKPTIIKDLFVENIKLSNKDDYRFFPSLRMVEFSLFQRAQLTKKPLKINDVMDCMISAFIPHVDAIITESFQANVCKKAKNHIPEMKNLEIYTLRDIRTE